VDAASQVVGRVQRATGLLQEGSFNPARQQGGGINAKELGRENQVFNTPPSSALKLAADRRTGHSKVAGEAATSLVKQE